jgi:hypothetical protein
MGYSKNVYDLGMRGKSCRFRKLDDLAYQRVQLLN